MTSWLLAEDGTDLLLEGGGQILLEDGVQPADASIGFARTGIAVGFARVPNPSAAAPMMVSGTVTVAQKAGMTISLVEL